MASSYGYLTNTRVKFVVVLSATDGQLKDADVRMVRCDDCACAVVQWMRG